MQYCSGMEYNNFMREGRSKNIKESALKSVCFFHEKVTYIHRSKFTVMQDCNLSKHLICEKLPFLHSLDVLIKIFAKPRCIKPTNTGKDRPCSLLSKTVDGKLSRFWFCLDKRLVCNCFFSIKNRLYTLYTQVLG